MRIPELSIIKNMRKQIGISQSELAKAAGVSQSLIARIESGKIDASYSKVKKIFIALEKLTKGKTLTAESIMSKKVFSISSSKSVKEAAMMMRKNDISQLPVIDGSSVVGSISEKNILESVSKIDLDDLAITPIKEVMEDPFPQLDKRTPLTVISFLLEYNSAVLITDKGRPAGIITKADLLKLFNKH